MNIPFPPLIPRLLDPKWFNADCPCDEESEIFGLEQRYQTWLTSVSQQYTNIVPIGKTAPEAMEEEVETDEEEGNDDTDESEESHDDDEDEELRGGYSPPPRPAHNNPPGGTMEIDILALATNDLLSTDIDIGDESGV